MKRPGPSFFSRLLCILTGGHSGPRIWGGESDRVCMKCGAIYRPKKKS
jgi:hypothetical protein